MNLRAFVNRIAVLVVPFLLLVAAVPATAQISVTSTSPNSADQGTVNLTVTVNGKGFKKGAQAQWFVTGSTNPGGVVVNSTAFVSATQLTANITVSDTAVIGNFDVQVMNADGRTGKGTELFAVRSKTQQVCQPTTTLQPIVISDACSTAGCLDATFGTGGMVTTNVTPNSTRGQGGRAVAVQPDGKLVAAGTSDGWIVVRYDTKGTLDPTFGVAGVANYFSGPSGVTSIALQPDGRIVVGGYVAGIDKFGTHYFAVGRLNQEGTLDSSFGSGGTVLLKLSRHNDFTQANAVLIQDDGKIVAVGFADTRWAILRFLSDGSLDNSFGTGGQLLLTVGDTSSGGSYLYAATLQYVALPGGGSEQRIVVAGSIQGNSTADDFGLARFLPNGQFDTTFGSAGMTTTDFCALDDRATSIAVDSAGHLVLSGKGIAGTDPTYLKFGVARYSANGQLDTSFGSAGKLLVDIPYNAPNTTDGYALIDAIDRIVVVGYVGNATAGNAFSAFRLNSDGSLDTTFANGALLQPAIPVPSGRVMQSDGKFVMTAGSNNLFAVWRILP